MANQLKAFFLLALLTAFLVFLGSLFGPEWAVAALVFALAMNFFAWWFSAPMVLAMYRARPVEPAEAPRLHQDVRELAAAAGLPEPRLYAYSSASPNAFATGRNPANAVVAVSTGLVDLLSPEEVRGVIAHEIGHIRDRDILVATIAATLAAAITFIATMIRWAAIFGGGGRGRRGGSPLDLVALLALTILAPLAAAMVQMALSRSREYQADAVGAKISGNPLYLASALRRLEEGTRRRPMSEANPATSHLFIVKPFSARGLASLFSTHPPVAERIARLERLAGRR